MLEWLVFGFAKENQVDLRRDRMAMQRLKEASEKAKCELSSAQETQVNLPFLYSEEGKAVHLMRTVTRSKFEELTRDLLERTVKICEVTLAEAGLSTSKISDVLLVGGQTRMPKLQEMVRGLFKREPLRGAHPDEVVALGAVPAGAIAGGRDAGDALARRDAALARYHHRRRLFGDPDSQEHDRAHLRNPIPSRDGARLPDLR